MVGDLTLAMVQAFEVMLLVSQIWYGWKLPLEQKHSCIPYLHFYSCVFGFEKIKYTVAKLTKYLLLLHLNSHRCNMCRNPKVKETYCN